MTEHDHKSGGNSVAIVVAIFLVLFLLVPCGLVVFGGFGFLVFSILGTKQMIIEEAVEKLPVESQPMELQAEPEPENVQPPAEESPATEPPTGDPTATEPPTGDPTATEPPATSTPSESRN